MDDVHSISSRPKQDIGRDREGGFTTIIEFQNHGVIIFVTPIIFMLCALFVIFILIDHAHTGCSTELP